MTLVTMHLELDLADGLTKGLTLDSGQLQLQCRWLTSTSATLEER